jgi:PTH1 family peptidyl-tRNA hydrolase
VKVIAGLGNPGEEHRDSRHNAGYHVVAGLADGFGIELSTGRGDFMTGAGSVAGEEVVLVMPLTYMNRSGDAVRDVLAILNIGVQDLLVVCDDVDLPLGQLRFRRRGTHGGHRGLGSIASRLGTDEFARLRLGVGRPPEGVDTSDFVLDRFLPEERQQAEDMEARAVDAVVLMLREGIGAAMNVYNRRPESDGGRGTEEAG